MTDYTTYCPDTVLFERNPVCGVCWRVCMDMCEEWGGPIQFDLLASMEAADRLCLRLIRNSWTLKGIEYYYHWLEAQLGFSKAAVTCATASGTAIFNGMGYYPASASGGSSVSLSSYSGGNSGGGPGGGGPGGW